LSAPSPARIGTWENFLWIHGNRYGEDEYDFEVNPFINAVIDYLNRHDFGRYPTLFECRASDLFSSFDAVWEGDLGTECTAERFFPGFSKDIDDVNDSIIFRGGSYAFDHTFIAVVTKGFEAKIFIRDNETNKYDEIVVPKDALLGLFSELKRAILETLKE